MNAVMVQVPLSERLELSRLQSALNSEEDVSEVQPFDGERVAQLLIILSPSTVPILINWIQARAKARATYKVVVDGAELSGYSADEIRRIIKALEKGD